MAPNDRTVAFQGSKSVASCELTESFIFFRERQVRRLREVHEAVPKLSWKRGSKTSYSNNKRLQKMGNLASVFSMIKDLRM